MATTTSNKIKPSLFWQALPWGERDDYARFVIAWRLLTGKDILDTRRFFNPLNGRSRLARLAWRAALGAVLAGWIYGGVWAIPARSATRYLVAPASGWDGRWPALATWIALAATVAAAAWATRARRRLNRTVTTPLAQALTPVFGFETAQETRRALRLSAAPDDPTATLALSWHRERTAVVITNTEKIEKVITGLTGLTAFTWDHRGARLSVAHPPLPPDHVRPLWQLLAAILKIDPTRPWDEWLTAPKDPTSPGARVRVALPPRVLTTEECNKIEKAIAGKTGLDVFDWDAANDVLTATRAPELPDTVQWQPSPDPHTLMIGQTPEGPAYVRTLTQSVCWAVTGPMGSGKTSALMLGVLHNRQHGALIDYIDLKEDSGEDYLFDKKVQDGGRPDIPGVRVHTTTRAAIAAITEFFVSMRCMTAARRDGFPPGQMPERVLVFDEWGSVRDLIGALTSGLPKDAQPRTAQMLRILLMQGRSKGHRLILGTHHMAASEFNIKGETAHSGNRDMFVFRLALGACSESKWRMCFPGMERLTWHSNITGRGACAYLGDENARLIQTAHLGPDPWRKLALTCQDQVPEWFTRGDIAPWITPAALGVIDTEIRCAAWMPKEGQLAYLAEFGQAKHPAAGATAQGAPDVRHIETDPSRIGTLTEEHLREQLCLTIDEAAAHVGAPSTTAFIARRKRVPIPGEIPINANYSVWPKTALDAYDKPAGWKKDH